MLGWLVVERLKSGHATTLGAASGLVAGLVAITPCAGFVGGMAPIYIGLIAGALCFLAVSLKFRFGYDDSLDVVGVHLVGGIVGSLLLGFFADATINPRRGQRRHVPRRWWDRPACVDQIVAVVATIVFSFVVTYVIVLRASTR